MSPDQQIANGPVKRSGFATTDNALGSDSAVHCRFKCRPCLQDSMKRIEVQNVELEIRSDHRVTPVFRWRVQISRPDSTMARDRAESNIAAAYA